jgi:hypothetical protein
VISRAAAYDPKRRSRKRRVASLGKHPAAMKSDALLRKKRQSLAMQPAKLHHEPKTFAITKIKGDNFVLGDAIEIAIRTKAKTARPAKFGHPFGTKDAHKMSVCGVIFTDRRHGIGHSKWMLAGYDDVPIGRYG